MTPRSRTNDAFMRPFIFLTVTLLLATGACPCASIPSRAQAQLKSDLPSDPDLTQEPATAETSTTSSGHTALTPEAWQDLAQHYAHEPSVQQVVAAALRVATQHPAHLKDLAQRARLRGLLPHVDLGVRRGQGIDLRWALTDDATGNRTTADDVMLFATLRFDLDKLIFSNEELSAEREARMADDAQRELIRKVVHVYFLRRRLQIERDLSGLISAAEQLRLAEAEALLDILTDGSFQRQLQRAGPHRAENQAEKAIAPTPAPARRATHP